MAFKTVFAPQFHLLTSPATWSVPLEEQEVKLGNLVKHVGRKDVKKLEKGTLPFSGRVCGCLRTWGGTPNASQVGALVYRKQVDGNFVVVDLPFIVLHIHLMSTRWRCPLTEQHQGLQNTLVPNNDLQ